MNSVSEKHRNSILANEAMNLRGTIERAVAARESIAAIVSPEAMEVYDESIRQDRERLAEIDATIPETSQVRVRRYAI